MHIYQKIYEFAASAGAFEGYVYRKPKTEIDMQALSNWVDNLLSAYENLPAAILDEIQTACNQTLGRAINSLIPVLSDKHELMGKLKKIVKGNLPDSADDFQKAKWFRE
jgi:hypothetical protein